MSTPQNKTFLYSIQRSALSVAFIFFSLVARSGTQSVHVTVHGNKTFPLSHLETLGLKKKWATVTRLDPNSHTTHKYQGYLLSDFVISLKQHYKLTDVDHLKTIASDGYKMTLNKAAINGKGAFLALRVANVPKEGLYNHSLKSHFDWRPAYILIGPGKSAPSVASPYQVVNIKVFEGKEKMNPLYSKVDRSHHKGLKTFIETCSKCHSHQGYGGNKAPAINLLLMSWKNKKDKDLKALLRDPQSVLGRKIQMSPFDRSEQELDGLIQFLRSLDSRD